MSFFRLLEKPDIPQELKITRTASRVVDISWSPPYSGNSRLLNYLLFQEEEKDNSFNSGIKMVSYFFFSIILFLTALENFLLEHYKFYSLRNLDAAPDIMTSASKQILILQPVRRFTVCTV